VQRVRGGLVYKAHRLVHHSTLGVRVIKKKTWVPFVEEGGEEEGVGGEGRGAKLPELFLDRPVELQPSRPEVLRNHSLCILLVPHPIMSAPYPLSSEFGTHKRVKARLWPWREPFFRQRYWNLLSHSLLDSTGGRPREKTLDGLDRRLRGTLTQDILLLLLFYSRPRVE